MNLLEAINSRHSVRSYTDKAIDGSIREQLKATIAECNSEGGLNIQLCLNEPGAFSGFMAKRGGFRNVRNYIALVGKKGGLLEEKLGYYGEKIVIRAQQLGLNTCWVGMTYKKGKSVAKVAPGEKLLMVISLGFGVAGGVPHKAKPIEKLCSVGAETPDWFRKGVEAAQLAPTALNQQKFLFTLSGNTVNAAVSGIGFCTKVDLGIAKYHFEVGAGKGGWEWGKK
jgi:hypothetical protein